MKEDAYLTELLVIYSKISDDKKSDFASRFTLRTKSPTCIFGWSAFLGYLGIDRFMLGQTVLGILKLVTMGGLGVWVIVDWFLVAGTARRQNLMTAQDIADTLK